MQGTVETEEGTIGIESEKFNVMRSIEHVLAVSACIDQKALWEELAAVVLILGNWMNSCLQYAFAFLRKVTEEAGNP